MNLNCVLEEYFRLNDLSLATEKTYQNVLRTFCRDTDINDIEDITIELVCRWKEDILSRAKPVTWNNYRRHMRALMNFAVNNSLASDNPFFYVKQNHEFQSGRKFCESKEILIILNALDNDIYCPGWFWKIVVKTFYYTGMRRRQLSGLKWSDIDFSKKKILLTAENSKTKKQWHIPLDDRLIPELLTLYRKSKLKSSAININSRVFNISLFLPSYHSDYLRPEYISKVFQRIGHRTGLKFSPHRIRHGFATQIGKRINNPGSTDLLTLKNQLGHSSINTTIRYVTPSIEPQRIIVSKLDDV